MQMNANQLTKIPVEKLSDTLQFLIAENEIPLSDALKQVIDDVDAVCKKLLRDESAPAQPVIPVGYFSYGYECGFSWHNTEKEAIEAAEAEINDYRGAAWDGWSNETDSVCWGVILQQATKVDERPRTDDDNYNPAIDTVCDYALLPAQESE